MKTSLLIACLLLGCAKPQKMECQPGDIYTFPEYVHHIPYPPRDEIVPEQKFECVESSYWRPIKP